MIQSVFCLTVVYASKDFFSFFYLATMVRVKKLESATFPFIISPLKWPLLFPAIVLHIQHVL